MMMILNNKESILSKSIDSSIILSSSASLSLSSTRSSSRLSLISRPLVSKSKMFMIFGLIMLWSSLLTQNLVTSLDLDRQQQPKQNSVDSTTNNNDNNNVQQQQQQLKDHNPTATIISKSLESLLDQLNGEQFVQLFDQLMDGELSRIINEIIKTKNNNKLDFAAAANRMSAKQFISLLDDYSSGLISTKIEKIFKQQQFRPRRSSFDSLTGLSMGYSKRSFDPMGGVSLGAPAKRGINFDEIDRAGFSGFAKRRHGAAGFDEMDHSGFDGFTKRRSSQDFDEMDHSGFAGFAKRFTDFDEIDHSGFNGFAKRSAEFDEMDHSGFVGFAKRHIQPSSNLLGKRSNFDELDHSGFSGFNRGDFGKRFVRNPVVDLINRAWQTKYSSIKH